MKVKHCFLLILIVLTSGSFFLALSVSPFFKSSLKSSNKDGSFLSLKSSESSNDRASNVKSSVDAASPNGAPSPKSVAPLNAPSPVVIQALNPASSSESVSDLAAKLTQCRSEMESFKSSLLPKDDSKDDLRVQLQEARIKLRAAEEELQTLLAQKPRDGEVEPTSQCRVFEREANLCKTELRSTHAKVCRLLCIRFSPPHTLVMHTVFTASHCVSAVHCAAGYRGLLFGPRAQLRSVLLRFFGRESAIQRQAAGFIAPS